MPPANLDGLLKSVSRSFYLSLRVLPRDLRAPMGLGYLLCRAADTVADTELLPPDRRLELLTEIHSLFSVFPFPVERGRAVAAKIAEEATSPRTAEGRLLARLAEAFDALRGLSNTDQALVQRVVVAVATGMTMDLRLFGSEIATGEVRALSTNAELESYVGWIGGEPGRFWTDVCAAHRPSLAASASRMSHTGFRFGTGLQLVNILRDLPTDLRNGRCYIPAERLSGVGLHPADLLDAANEDRFRGLYHELIDDALSRLSEGMNYIESLGMTAVRLRAAVWYPLAIGLKTLALLRESRPVLGVEKPPKVRRRDVYWILATSAPLLPSSRLLRMDFNDLSEAASSATGLAARGG